MMTRSVLIAFVNLILCCCIVAGSEYQCPPGLRNREDHVTRVRGRKCYLFQQNLVVNFQTAQNYCRRRGGNLAIVTSSLINGFLTKELLALKVYTPFWIGLMEVAANEKFKWVDGTPMTYENFNPHGNIEWLLRVKQNCVALDPSTKGGQWQEYDCKTDFFFYRENPFICEFPAIDRSPQKGLPPKCPPPLIQDEYSSMYRGSCYRFEVDKELAYQPAAEYCRNYGGNLVVIDSKQVNDVLTKRLQSVYKFYDSVWIGLSNLMTDNNKMEWVNGDPVTYRNFVSLDNNTPNGPVTTTNQNSSNCFALDSNANGQWRGDNCSTNVLGSTDNKKPFICEYPIKGRPTPPPKVKPTTKITTKATSTLIQTLSTTGPTLPVQTLSTTTMTTTTTNPCQQHLCKIDCGMAGFKMDPVTGCMKCECDDE